CRLRPSRSRSRAWKGPEAGGEPGTLASVGYPPEGGCLPDAGCPPEGGCPPGFGESRGATTCPSRSDTVGCFTTASLPCNPAWMSIEFPKSRPSVTSWKCSLFPGPTITTRVPCALKMTAVDGTRQRVPEGAILKVT